MLYEFITLNRDDIITRFTVSQVVDDYGDVCQTVTDLALESNAPISTEDFRMLNRCLDEAIAGAVTMYTRESQESRSEDATRRDNERLGFLVHELRNLVNTAVIAFEALKSGKVAIGGSTGAVLNRSLTGLRDLVARTIEEVRVSKVVQNKTRTLVSEFMRRSARPPRWKRPPAASRSWSLRYRQTRPLT